MSPLLLGLVLTSAPNGVAHPPVPVQPVPGAPFVSPFQPPAPAPYRSAQYPPQPIPIFPAPGHAGPMTLEHFARCFKPTPGHHHVCIIHPATCKPVQICFTLPGGCGCPKVELSRRSVAFDYGKAVVEIEFRRNGTVDVDYD